MNSNTRLIRNKSLTTAELDGQVVMLNVDTSRYYGLNSVGSRIWELLAQPLTVAELCRTLQTEYDVSPDQCEREVIAIAQKLLDEKLLQVA